MPLISASVVAGAGAVLGFPGARWKGRKPYGRKKETKTAAQNVSESTKRETSGQGNGRLGLAFDSSVLCLKLKAIVQKGAPKHLS